MAATETRPIDRVVWVGTGRRSRRGSRRFFGGNVGNEPEREWRERLAQEMNEARDEMASRGLRLAAIVPVQSSGDLRGGWTEGTWLHFTRAE